jgi:glutamate carboxypeptidase
MSVAKSAAHSNEPRIDGEEILDGILEWVEIETPTHQPDAVNTLADVVQRLYEGLGAAVERTPGHDGIGDVLRARIGDPAAGPGILVLSHMDTVHPFGTKDGPNPIRREGDSVFGPGIYDMKAGAYLPYYAYRHMRRLGREPGLPVTFMLVPEEEVGSPISRALIEEEARRHKYVLVTEPARDGGKVVTARKGVARFSMTITGRPSHSGAQHQDGRSAIKEMARQILAIEALTDYDRGVTLNVGQVSGGTAVNVVPRDCSAEIDMRVVTVEDGEAFTAKLLDLQAHDPDVTVAVTGGMNRPPYERRPENMALFEKARACAANVGFELESTLLTGGGSDGNFTAALGVPTLDGLGADGKGAHTHHEQIYFSSLEPRAKMWVRLLETLT